METIGDSEEFRGFEAKNHPLRCGNSLRNHHNVGGVGRLGMDMITTESRGESCNVPNKAWP